MAVSKVTPGGMPRVVSPPAGRSDLPDMAEEEEEEEMSASWPGRLLTIVRGTGSGDWMTVIRQPVPDCSQRRHGDGDGPTPTARHDDSCFGVCDLLDGRHELCNQPDRLRR